MQRYDAFCSAVTRALRDATAGERAAVGRELREHLEDHAAALIEGGMGSEEAASAAVDAMGDPGEIGRALNRAYPRRWRVLYRLSALFAGLLVCALLLPMTLGVIQRGDHIIENLSARQENFGLQQEGRHPLNVKAQARGQVFRVYAVSYELRDDAPAAELFVVNYAALPWDSCAASLYQPFTFYDAQGEALPWAPGGGMGSGRAYAASSYYVTIDEDDRMVELRSDWQGESFSLDIPIRWQLPERAS